jgi:hypothetical protein
LLGLAQFEPSTNTRLAFLEKKRRLVDIFPVGVKTNLKTALRGRFVSTTFEPEKEFMILNPWV